MKLYNKNELVSSRIFFDKKPPIFLTIFIVFTLFLIVISIWISSFIPKNYIVEAQGSITTMDNTYVASLTNGVVVQVFKEEGSAVNIGDELFSISSGNEGIQYSAIQDQLMQLESKKNAMIKFTQSLESGINYMSNSGVEQEYYGKMEFYLTLVKDEKESALNLQRNLAKKEDKKTTKEKEISDIQEQLNKLIENEDNLIKKQELQSSLESKKLELETINEELIQLQQQGSSSQAYQTKLQLISEIGSARTSLESSIVELKGQLAAYKNQDSLHVIKATQNGYIHYLSPLKEGMMLQQAQTIAEISENDESEMIVESYINASDISKVKINDPVNVAINGVNTQRFGMLDGVVKSIDVGTLTQKTNDGTAILYRCLISIHDKELKAKDGETVKLMKSMPIVSRIVYDKETYLDWLLELLSFKN